MPDLMRIPVLSEVIKQRADRAGCFMAIDPSIKKMGVCIFDSADSAVLGLVVSGKNNWVERVDETAKWVSKTVVEWSVRRVVIEMPSIWMDSKRGKVAARTSIPKLIFQVASIRQRLILQGVRVLLVPVAQWKGQSPKHITQRRMLRRYGEVVSELDHNIVDALGIATWYVERS